MYVYVDDVEELVVRLRAEAVQVLKTRPTCHGVSASPPSPTRAAIPLPSPTSPAANPSLEPKPAPPVTRQRTEPDNRCAATCTADTNATPLVIGVLEYR